MKGGRRTGDMCASIVSVSAPWLKLVVIHRRGGNVVQGVLASAYQNLGGIVAGTWLLPC